MLGPARDDEQLAGLQVHRPVAKFDVERAFDNQEKLIGVVVLMPHARRQRMGTGR